MQINSSYRGDRMCWLQPTHSGPALQAAAQSVLSLQKGMLIHMNDSTLPALGHRIAEVSHLLIKLLLWSRPGTLWI